MEDYYEILGVPYNASAEALKSAYRTLVKRWHPDVCKQPDAHQRCAKIIEAYEILSNPHTRQEYDICLRSFRRSAYAGQSYTAQAEPSESFNQARRAAQQQAEEYARKPLEELLALLFAVGGAAIAAGVEAGKYVWKGESSVREDGLSFGARIAIGFKGCLLLLMIILTFTGYAAPITLPIGFVVYNSLKHNHRFIGIGTLLGSTILFMFMVVIIIGVLVIQLNSWY